MTLDLTSVAIGAALMLGVMALGGLALLITAEVLYQRDEKRRQYQRPGYVDGERRLRAVKDREDAA